MTRNTLKLPPNERLLQASPSPIIIQHSSIRTPTFSPIYQQSPNEPSDFEFEEKQKQTIHLIQQIPSPFEGKYRDDIEEETSEEESDFEEEEEWEERYLNSNVEEDTKVNGNWNGESLHKHPENGAPFTNGHSFAGMNEQKGKSKLRSQSFDRELPKMDARRVNTSVPLGIEQFQRLHGEDPKMKLQRLLTANVDLVQKTKADSQRILQIMATPNRSQQSINLSNGTTPTFNGSHSFQRPFWGNGNGTVEEEDEWEEEIDIEQLIQDNEELRRMATVAEKEIGKAHRQVERLTEEKEGLSKSLSKLQRVHSDAKGELERMTQQYGEKAREVNEWQESFRSLQVNYQQLLQEKEQFTSMSQSKENAFADPLSMIEQEKLEHLIQQNQQLASNLEQLLSGSPELDANQSFVEIQQQVRKIARGEKVLQEGIDSEESLTRVPDATLPEGLVKRDEQIHSLTEQILSLESEIFRVTKNNTEIIEERDQLLKEKDELLVQVRQLNQNPPPLLSTPSKGIEAKKKSKERWTAQHSRADHLLGALDEFLVKSEGEEDEEEELKLKQKNLPSVSFQDSPKGSKEEEEFEGDEGQAEEGSQIEEEGSQVEEGEKEVEEMTDWASEELWQRYPTMSSSGALGVLGTLQMHNQQLRSLWQQELENNAFLRMRVLELDQSSSKNDSLNISTGENTTGELNDSLLSSSGDLYKWWQQEKELFQQQETNIQRTYDLLNSALEELSSRKEEHEREERGLKEEKEALQQELQATSQQLLTLKGALEKERRSKEEHVNHLMGSYRSEKEEWNLQVHHWEQSLQDFERQIRLQKDKHDREVYALIEEKDIIIREKEELANRIQALQQFVRKEREMDSSQDTRTMLGILGMPSSRFSSTPTFEDELTKTRREKARLVDHNKRYAEEIANLKHIEATLKGEIASLLKNHAESKEELEEEDASLDLGELQTLQQKLKRSEELRQNLVFQKNLLVRFLRSFEEGENQTFAMVSGLLGSQKLSEETSPRISFRVAAYAILAFNSFRRHIS